MNNPFISIIVNTKNEEKNIKNILESLRKQSYKNTEIIVVDNNSTDRTEEIAKRYTDKVYNKGQERSNQKNFGAETAKGEFILFLDADMILSKRVVEDCVNQISQDKNIGGIIIPEISIGKGFWARCKSLEKSFYLGIDHMEAARFYKKAIFRKTGGFDPTLIAAEDWDLSQRISKTSKIDRINSCIYHNEGKLKLLETLKKKFYYAKNINKYLGKNRNSRNAKQQTNILKRFGLYFSHPIKLFKDPIKGVGMLFMKFCEFSAGGIGYLIGKIRKIYYKLC